ncbi:uncharacterized protein B0I36DRAFT_232212, partial [Microdochium trichocladiopsis]
LATILALTYLIPLSFTVEREIDEAEARASVACLKAEAIGSTVISMPHYLSQGVNSLTAEGITHSVRAIASSLDLILDGMEQLLLFVFHSMTDTYVCLLLMAVHGGLNITISAMEEFRSLYQDATTGSLQAVEESVAATNQGIDSVNAFLSKGSNTVNGDVQQLPHLNIADELESIRNTHIDMGPILSDLDSLQQRIPDFATVRNITDTVLTSPFRAVRTELDQTLRNWVFDQKELFVPDKQSFVFCSNDTTFTDLFQKQRNQIRSARIVLMLIPITMFYFVVLEVIFQYYVHSRNLRVAEVLTESSKLQRALAAVSLSVTKFRASERSWSGNASAFLLIGLSGLMGCAFATLFLRTAEDDALELREAIEIRAEEVSASLHETSTLWANSANSAMGRLNENITGQLQDQIRRVTVGLNTTVTTFSDQLQQALTSAFGDSILRDVVQQALRCLIGTKIDAVQNGLRWVNDQVSVDFPPLPQDVFSVGVSMAQTGLDHTMLSGGDIIMDNIISAIMYVTDKVRRDISTHAIISSILLLVYLVLLLVDMAILKWTSGSKT